MRVPRVLKWGMARFPGGLKRRTHHGCSVGKDGHKIELPILYSARLVAWLLPVLHKAAPDDKAVSGAVGSSGISIGTDLKGS